MNTKALYIIIGILVLIIVAGGFFFLTNNKSAQQSSTQRSVSNQQAQTSAPDTTMVDCGELKNPQCFFDRMSSCLPVKAKLTGNDGSSIEIAILGVENEKCHFQRKLNGEMNLNCFFPKGTLNWETIDQTFGNDHGLQKVVDDACKPAGW